LSNEMVEKGSRTRLKHICVFVFVFDGEKFQIFKIGSINIFKYFL